jgi:ribosomal protein S27E
MSNVLDELRKRYGFSSRVGRVSCKVCGKEIETPNIISDKEREVLNPYCATHTIFLTQWLLHHGWHVTRWDTNPSGAFLCPDCYAGQPEYHEAPYAADWCEQAEKWMHENNGVR